MLTDELRQFLDARFAAHEAKSATQLEITRREIREDMEQVLDRRLAEISKSLEQASAALNKVGEVANTHETRIQIHAGSIDRLDKAIAERVTQRGAMFQGVGIGVIVAVFSSVLNYLLRHP